MRHVYAFFLCSLLAVALATTASGQTSSTSDQVPPQTPKPSDQPQNLDLIEGTIDSIGAQTIVVKTDDNQYHLFVFDSGVVRPNGLTKGTRVKVASKSSDEPGLRIVTGIGVIEPGATSVELTAPPKEMVAMQREIENQARKWRLGFKIGAGLDPELFLFGVQSDIGPIFSRDFYFRPSAEFAFGELTDMIAINLEGAYRLPVTFREGRWSSYVGAGVGLNFIHQGVGRSDISFSNFEYQTGMNIFTGVKFRRGTFAEVKTSLWARGVPTLRLAFGYMF
jgi:hypothetical protein